MANDASDDHGKFEDRSKAVLAVTIVMICLSTVFVLFRMLSRAAIVKRVSVDDYFMVVAWALAFGLSFSICYGTANGLGRHERDVPASWQKSLKESNYAFSVLYQPALMATKTSILAFYLSLSTANRIFKWACILTLIIVNAGGLALTLLTVFQCTPVEAVFQTPAPTAARCTDVLTIYLSSIPLNMITDLALLLLPMPILTSMRLPRKQKIILVVTFSFGIFVAVVDVVRIAYLQSAAMTRLAEIQRAQVTTHGSARRAVQQTDSSWYLSLSFMWSAIEVNVGIMCACVPGLKPLVARFLPTMLRDPGDLPSKFGSFSEHPAESRTAPPPSFPDDVHFHDFGRTAASGDEDGAMGMMDFLTTPDMVEAHTNRIHRTDTALTNTSRNTAPEPAQFFDFVNMSGRKPMVQLSGREAVFPIAVVTIMFFIWGFEYGLLNVLNHQFQSVAHVTRGEETAIHSAYFAGYIAGPLLIGRLILKHWGFKACFPVGLSVYAAGLLIFWPSAVLTSWPAFLATNFIVGLGLSLLECAANPFIALCGPPEYGEMRLNLAQGIQAVGSVIAPFVANKAFLQKSQDAPSLVATQWAYLGMALATVALAVIYFYIPLPEATDAEFDDAAERIDGANQAKYGRVPVTWVLLGLGVFSQFCYVGGQEVNSTAYASYLTAMAPGYNQANYMAIAHTAFAVSRFLAAGLGYWVRPRLLLLCFYCGLVVFEALAMNTTGDTGVAMITMVFFMEGPLFSLIFAQALRGLGRHTKLGSVLITAAIGGGAVFSPISNQITASQGRPAHALVVAVAAFAAGTLFAVGLNVDPKARALADPVHSTAAAAAAADDRSDPSSTSSRRLSRAFSILKKRRKDLDVVEYQERKASTSDGS